MEGLSFNKKLDNLWIARVNVKPRDGFKDALNGRPGAFVNIIVKAHNIKELKSLANKVFFEDGISVIKFIDKDIELLSERLKRTTIDQDLLDLVNDINEAYPVQFGVFHTYPEEDETE